MSDILQGGGEGRGAANFPYRYTTWLRERGSEGGCVPSPWVPYPSLIFKAEVDIFVPYFSF